jgi:hypothetical protein
MYRKPVVAVVLQAVRDRCQVFNSAVSLLLMAEPGDRAKGGVGDIAGLR